ncbi:hypothetical protein HK405_001095 [Cladochytrium tenue]|nr:hypothetical protein HK405_001095 [Cladochytrium tenue]
MDGHGNLSLSRKASKTSPRSNNLEIEDADDDEYVSFVPDHGDVFQALKDEVASLHSSVGAVDDIASLRGAAADLQDPRCNPESEAFSHPFFLKTVRQILKLNNMSFSEMPIAFKDLKVFGDAAGVAYIPTVGSTLLGILTPLVQLVNFARGVSDSLVPRRTKVPKEIIKGITGTVRPGELLLVLGRPGSGCSSLLRTLANRTKSFKEVTGTITFAGFSAGAARDQYRGEIAFAEEGDPHYPSLTVRQTLDFVLGLRVLDPKIRARLANVVLRLYGLVRCQNTVVGDASLRGVSGGEKKQATCIGGSVGVFDGCTKGLDAAAALDFVRSLRSFADYSSRVVVASCYQASDAMYEHFDKVAILEDGFCVYFGPASQAVAYFESLGFTKLPRETVPDFLTTCASSGTHSAADLHARFASSSTAAACLRDADALLAPDVANQCQAEFTESLRARRKALGADDAHASGPTVAPVRRQLALLMARELQILRGNPAPTIMTIFFNMVMATIVGSVFLQLPADTSGAYTRGGAIFFALLFNAVSAVSELPAIMNGRPVLYKHKDCHGFKGS